MISFPGEFPDVFPNREHLDAYPIVNPRAAVLPAFPFRPLLRLDRSIDVHRSMEFRPEDYIADYCPCIASDRLDSFSSRSLRYVFPNNMPPLSFSKSRSLDTLWIHSVA